MTTFARPETDTAGTAFVSGRARGHAPFLITAAACIAIFTWMLTYGSGRLVADDDFANFYDYQAQAWLHGRWDVPEPALSGEAFVVEGKVYGYFGPTPALMRLPLVVAGVGFGRVTRLFMLIDYAAALIGAYFVLREAARQGSNSGPSATLVACYTATVGLGSTLFFLSSRAYVYHEAILCGAAFGLWSVWCTLRYVAEPHRRSWLGALICGVLAVHARPPIGLYALTFLGFAAIWSALCSRRQTVNPADAAPSGRVRRHLAIAAAAVLGVASYNAVSYLKFGTIEGCPLRYNVQYTPERLASFGGKNFSLGNLRFNADSYLLVPSASLRRHFPYVFLEYLDRKQYPESRMAYRDATLAIPYAMPALVFLAVIGGAAALAAVPRSRRPLVLIWAAAGPLLIAMLTAVAVTERYTADFCVWLVPAAAFGGIGLWRESRRALGIPVVVALTAVGIGVQSAITLHNQRAVVWGVPREFQQQYERWQQRIDGVFHVEPGR